MLVSFLNELNLIEFSFNYRHSCVRLVPGRSQTRLSSSLTVARTLRSAPSFAMHAARTSSGKAVSPATSGPPTVTTPSPATSAARSSRTRLTSSSTCTRTRARSHSTASGASAASSGKTRSRRTWPSAMPPRPPPNRQSRTARTIATFPFNLPCWISKQYSYNYIVLINSVQRKTNWARHLLLFHM